jgi:1,4-dihydroxy-2-naphthoate polyprenyltransferase
VPAARALGAASRGAVFVARGLALVRLGRPHFLIGGFLLYGLGALVAVRQGARFRSSHYWLGQMVITAFQLMTHYANDYFDLEADLANLTPTMFSGGSRVLPDGQLPPLAALISALGLAFVGTAAALRLAVFPAGEGQPLAAGVLLVAGALAWAYSAPPLALHSRGWGEVATAVVVTGLTPLAGYLLQARASGSAARPSMGPLLAVLWPLALLQFNMLLTIELPDAAGDAAVGKRTLVVRVGDRIAARLSQLTLFAAYGSLPILAWLGLLPVSTAVALAVTSPVAAWQIWRLGRGDWARPERWGSLAFRAVALLVATAACAVAGLGWLVLGSRHG